MSEARLTTDCHTIAAVAARFDLTYRTLRFYEERGLIHPKRVGVERIYDSQALVRIQIILVGKRLGLSLTEVGKLISTHRREELSGNAIDDLGLSKQDIEHRIGLLEQQVVSIEASLAELRKALVFKD